jgi:hypothetical protein
MRDGIVETSGALHNLHDLVMIWRSRKVESTGQPSRWEMIKGWREEHMEGATAL